MGGSASLQDELERLVAESSASLAGMHETLQQSASSRQQAEEDERLFHRLSVAVAEAPDASQALGTMLAAVCAHTGWPYGEAWTMRRADACLRLVADHHHETPRALRYAAQSAGFTYPVGVGIPGRAWEAREALWVPDLAADPKLARSELCRFSEYVAVAAIPVLSGRDPVALLLMHLRAPREGDRALVDRLARVLARVGAGLHQRLVLGELAAFEHEVSRSFQASPVAGLVMTMSTGEVVDVNERFLARYGFRRDEVVGANALDLGLWSRAADRAAAMMRLLEDGEPTQLGAHVRTRAGALVPVRAVLDVTERAGVRCARAHVMDAVDPGIAPGDFRGLCDALPTGLAVMGGTRCLWANTALRVELGLTGADDDPVDALSWLPPAAHEEARSREASALCSTIGPDTTALLATNGRSVEVVCSAGVPVVFAGAPAALHTVEPADRARVRLGSGAAPAPSRNRYRTPR